MSESQRGHVLILGQGYVGLPLAMAVVAAGFEVTGLDLDDRKVESLNGGRSHVEDVPDAVLRKAVDSGWYRAVTSMADVTPFDVVVISVPTPLKESVPDLSFIEAASRMIATRLRPGVTVVLESTTYPGTTEELVRPILEAGSGLEAGADFFLGYSPERIDPGNAHWRLENTPKVVSGIDGPSLERVRAFFDLVVERTVPVRGTREAELAKLLENTFRHVNIALVNELAMFAGDLDIDIWDAIDAASTKPFGFMRFTPGPGVGGHCLPVDPSYLSWQVRRRLGTNFRFVELANDINDHMPDYVVARIGAALNRRAMAVKGTRIVVLGLAYKRNTGDTRESPSRRICTNLVELGATVVAVDPFVRPDVVPQGVTLVSDVDEAISEADLMVLVVDHAAFGTDRLLGAGIPILDCRNALPPSDLVERL